MKKLVLFTSILLATSLIIGFSCKKKSDPEPTPTNSPTDYTAAADNSLAESSFDDVFKQTKEGCKSGESQIGLNGKEAMKDANKTCPTVTITPFDTTSWPKTLTVDFGTSCVGSDGVTRSGKIIITASQRWRTQNATFTITTDNYYSNGFKIEGTKTITNNGRNVSNNFSYTVVVTNGKVTKPNNGGIITWNSNRTNEWYAGEFTLLNPLDDVYHITGTANGVSAANKTYNYTITEALEVQIGCRYIKDGKITLTVQGTPTLTVLVDYGDGTCDANATAYINNVAYPFVMQY